MKHRKAKRKTNKRKYAIESWKMYFEEGINSSDKIRSIRVKMGQDPLSIYNKITPK